MNFSNDLFAEESFDIFKRSVGKSLEVDPRGEDDADFANFKNFKSIVNDPDANTINDNFVGQSFQYLYTTGEDDDNGDDGHNNVALIASSRKNWYSEFTKYSGGVPSGGGEFADPALQQISDVPAGLNKKIDSDGKGPDGKGPDGKEDPDGEPGGPEPERKGPSPDELEAIGTQLNQFDGKRTAGEILNNLENQYFARGADTLEFPDANSWAGMSQVDKINWIKDKGLFMDARTENSEASLDVIYREMKKLQDSNFFNKSDIDTANRFDNWGDANLLSFGEMEEFLNDRNNEGFIERLSIIKGITDDSERDATISVLLRNAFPRFNEAWMRGETTEGFLTHSQLTNIAWRYFEKLGNLGN